MMTFLASVKCMQRRDDWHHSETPQKGGVSFTETRVWKRQTHLGLVERKERGRAALALGRRGRGQRCARLLWGEESRKEGQRSEKRGKRYMAGWWRAEEKEKKYSKKRENLITRRRRRKLTNSGRVAGAERGIRGQGGGALRPGEWCSRRRAGVRCLGWAERPYLSEGSRSERMMLLNIRTVISAVLHQQG